MQTISNPPSPSILSNSMRSIGYSFSTALADIIDNSITAKAKNIYITTPISNNPKDKIYVSILDDGFGMDNNELFNAMKYGSSKDYGAEDLGRFGLGLKSASLSQCKVLTVISKKNGEIHGFRWDLDLIAQNDSWDCLCLSNDEMIAQPQYKELDNLEHGTLVIWENFDVLEKECDGDIRSYLSEKVEDAETHLRLVFHRFLNSRKLKIFINMFELKGFDPFLENNPKTDTREPSSITLNGSTVTVQPYILPYQDDLTDEDLELLGGKKSFRDNQGFYIYRNKRLIISGTWFKISSDNLSPDLYKYGRIKVDIPNTLDDIWSIDVKKQTANIPRRLLENLKSIVAKVKSRSKQKSDRRARLKFEEDNSLIWNKVKDTATSKTNYFININSNFIRQSLDEFEDNDKKRVIRLLEVVSSQLPLNDIYNSMANRNCENIKNDDVKDSIVSAGMDFFYSLKKIMQKDDDEVLKQMSTFEPFNETEIITLIRERIKK